MGLPFKEVKQRTDIVAIFQKYFSHIQINQRGKHIRCECPFGNHTQDGSSRLKIDVIKGSMYCYSCEASHDVVSLVAAQEGLTLAKACIQLAESVGIEIKQSADYERRNKEREKYVAMYKSAIEFYQVMLRRNKDAKAYADSRGLDDESCYTLGLGYAPNDGHLLHGFLANKGYSDADMQWANLIKPDYKNPNRLIDTFRHRLIFPIYDTNGDPIAFMGRALADWQKAKYLNTATTPFFDKSKTLFMLDKAKQAIIQEGFAYVFEGNMDAITAYLNGYKNAVAGMGGALSKAHISVLGKFTKKIVLVLDGDTAGQKAMERAAYLLISLKNESDLDIEMRVVVLPDNLDPDELIRQDKEKWEWIIANDVPLIDFLIDTVTSGIDQTSVLAGEQVKEKIYPALASLTHGDKRAFYIKRIADWFGYSFDVIEKSYNRWQANQQVKIVEKPQSILEDDLRPFTIQDRILAYVTQNPDIMTTLWGAGSLLGQQYHELVNMFDGVAREYYSILWEWFLEEFVRTDGMSFGDYIKRDYDDLVTLYQQLADYDLNAPDDELRRNWRRLVLQRKLEITQMMFRDLQNESMTTPPDMVGDIQPYIQNVRQQLYNVQFQLKTGAWR